MIVPRRGVFVLHARGRELVADANTLLVLGAGDEHRVSHPAASGDRCTVLVFPPKTFEDALGSQRARQGLLHPSTQLGVHLLTAALVRGHVEPLEAEVATVSLLAAFAGDLGVPGPTPTSRSSAVARRRVVQVRALLAAEPGAPWGLATVARAACCSPYHLARQFRAVTGESIARYLLRLRLALALERLCEGERHLSRLAAELGFAHHSHLSARFRALLGVTPTSVRDAPGRSRLDEVRTIVTAADAAPS